MNTVFIDPRASTAAIRRGQPLVEAPRETHAVAGVLGVARGRRLDSTGGLRYLGFESALRALIGQAMVAGVVASDSLDKIGDITKRLLAARSKQAEGRLDSATLEIRNDRLDSANPSAAIALARELEYIYSEVVREERPILSARKLFEVDRSVPVGAKTHTIRRIESGGEAMFYRAGEKIPFVGIGRDEETFPVRHAVIGLEMDFFNQQADAYAGINEYGEKVRAAQEAMDEFVNVAFWYGSEVERLFGVLTYPWLRKRLIARNFNAIASDADFTAKLADLHNMVSEVLDRNPGMSASLRFITSPGMVRYMGQSRHPTSQRTLMELFMQGNPSISSVEEAPELQGAGPSGQDGFLIVPKGTKAPKLVMPADFTMMPMQITNYGFSQSQAAYVSLGGVVMRDVLRSVLVWATRS